MNERARRRKCLGARQRTVTSLRGRGSAKPVKYGRLFSLFLLIRVHTYCVRKEGQSCGRQSVSAAAPCPPARDARRLQRN